MKRLRTSLLLFFCASRVCCQCGEYLDSKYKADSCYKKNNFEKSAFYYKKCLDYSEKQRSDYYYLSRSLLRINEIDSALCFYKIAADNGLRYLSLKDFYKDSIFQKLYHQKEWKPILSVVERNTKKVEQSQKKHLPLLKLLLEKKLLDQKYRAPELFLLPQNIQDSLWRLQKKIDIDNQQWLKMEIEQNEWPGISKAGTEGDEAAWLIAQHADNDTAFQHFCLIVLNESWKKKDTQLKNIAYLEDRLLINSNKEQLYGTQFEPVTINNKTTDLKLKPTMDMECLNKRRFNMGLQSVEEYLDFARKRYVHQ